MEPTPKKKDLMVSEDVASLKKNINKTVKSNKCYQCDYAFSKASDLKRHYEIHSGEKPNKCNRCVYASSYARGGDKSKSPTNATNVTLRSPRQAI